MSKKLTIIWDLDGTLSNCDAFVHHLKTKPENWSKWNENIINHEPYEEMVHLFNTFHYQGHDNYIVTSRMENVRTATEEWLVKHGMANKYLSLHMRGMKDFRPDYELKLTILNTLRGNGIYPDIAFEDRGSVVQMYRENGLRCFQVKDGDY